MICRNSSYPENNHFLINLKLQKVINIFVNTVVNGSSKKLFGVTFDIKSKDWNTTYIEYARKLLTLTKKELHESCFLCTF